MEREITPKTVTLEWLDYINLKNQASQNKNFDYKKALITILQLGNRIDIIRIGHSENHIDISVRPVSNQINPYDVQPLNIKVLL